MKAVCTAPFYDKLECVDRAIGDEFECTEARLKEINGARFGQLAKGERKQAPRKKAPAKE